MIMRKPAFYLCLAAFSFLTLALVSCAKDDVPDPSTIIGDGSGNGGESPKSHKASDFTGVDANEEGVASCTWTCFSAQKGNENAQEYLGQSITMGDDYYYASGIPGLGEEGSWGIEGLTIFLNGRGVSRKFFVQFMSDGTMIWTLIASEGETLKLKFARES